MYKLEKKLRLYKNQFDQYLLDLYGDYRVDRTSLDLDALLFRIKYMLKHQKDLDQIPKLKDQFREKSTDLRVLFSDIVNYLLMDLSWKDYNEKQIHCIQNGEEIMIWPFDEILVQDVKIDAIYVNFTMILLCEKESALQFVDTNLPDADQSVYNLYPNTYFRFYTDSYNDGIAKAYPELFKDREQHQVGTGDDADVFVHNLTFQTSEACSLSCSYCYQFNKSPMRMEFDTAKQFIDHLLNDDYGYINRYNSPAVILEFIGGEPLLEISLTRKIYEYFLDQCYELNHPWFTMHRLSICSNGLQYFDDEVQSFFQDYSHNISFNISIDGNKELHDSCRVQPNGEGSYEIAMAALNHYTSHYNSERNSKMTLAPSNISYLYDSVVDFIKNGMRSININCVFEEGWTVETAQIEYHELKKLADYLIDNNLENIYVAIFNERPEGPQEQSFDGSACGGGSGSMIAIRPNGQIYPCIRYMPTSVGDDVKDLCMGTVQDGFIERSDNSEVIQLLDNCTRRGYTNDICYECPIANDCAYCAALNHTVFNTPNKRTTFTCIQMIAEALANVYYWNRLLMCHIDYDLEPRINQVPKEWARLILTEYEWEELCLLESAATLKWRIKIEIKKK